MAVETEEVTVKPLPPEQIIRDRAAAAAKAGEVPDEPMDAIESDVVGHPSTGFNLMADKLEKAMAEVTKKGAAKDTTDASPKEMKQASSKKADPAAATATDPEAEPADDPMDMTITSAKAANWKALKEKAKTHEAQAKEWETKHKLIATEYEEFRKKGGDVAVIESTKKERDEIKAERDRLKSELATVALERDPQFQAFYQEQFDSALAKAKDAAGPEAERVQQLMALPPSAWRKDQLNAIRDELVGLDQDALGRAVDAYDDARKDREAKLKDGPKQLEKLKAMEAEKALNHKVMMDRRREAITTSILQVARDYESFKPSDDPDNNAAVAKNEAFVKRFIEGTLEGPDLALLPVLATEAKRYKEVVVPSMAKEIKELKAALGQYQGANPSPAGGGKLSPNEQASSFIDRFNKEWPQGNR